MNGARQIMNTDKKGLDSPLLARHLKDYASVGLKLIVQRQISFAGAIGIAGFYYSLNLAILFVALVIISELFDYFTFRSIQQWDGHGRDKAQRHLVKLLAGTLVSAGNVVYYAVSIATIQGPGPHFLSLFFLLAAGLFAAMHNHQVVVILMLRLVIYGVAFIGIPAWDIFTTGAEIHSELWAQLFTSIIALYFVIDCSRNYLSIYRVNQAHLQALGAETRKARAASNAKTEFLSTISHELRTPLTSIKGSIDLMKAGGLGAMTEKATKALTIAQRNCDRLIKLVDETLDVQKIIAGKMSFDMDKVDVSKLVEASVNGNLPFAARLGVKLDMAPVDPTIFINGDWARLEQVLANILSNAAKFTAKGSTVRVVTEVIEGRVRVSVIDQGVGLTEKDRSNVFDKFAQVEAAQSRKVNGTGLGMNISEKIMQAHDGKIDFYKNDGPGTTFYIEMKLLGSSATRAAQPNGLKQAAE